MGCFVDFPVTIWTWHQQGVRRIPTIGAARSHADPTYMIAGIAVAYPVLFVTLTTHPLRNIGQKNHRPSVSVHLALPKEWVKHIARLASRMDRWVYGDCRNPIWPGTVVWIVGENTRRELLLKIGIMFYNLGKCRTKYKILLADGFSWWMGFLGGCY